jgi:peptidoglycan/xylan/chitin deacetylase (PgdA/CDA1 family)
MRRRTGLSQLVVLLVGLFGSMLAAAADSAVVFMYHHVATGTPPITSVTAARFAEQLDYLDREGYAVLPLMAVIEALRAGRPLADKAVVLTFDDGYESVLTNALPELARRSWPFTVFVSTDAADGGYGGYLDWQGLRRLTAAGATIGNHTRSHTHLVRRLDAESEAGWRQRIGAEIDAADARLREQLGDAVIPVLAYPYGEYDEQLQAIVSQRSLVAFGQHSGALGTESDWTALPRFPVATGYDDLDEFALRARTRPLKLRVDRQSLIVRGDRRPELIATLTDSDIRPAELACYASGQGRMSLTWLDSNQTQFVAKPERALAVGRSKYNCTAPSASASGVFHWYGQVLMALNTDGSWYAE